MSDDFDHVAEKVGLQEKEIRDLFADRPGDADIVIAELKRAVDPPWLGRFVEALLPLERFRCYTTEEVAQWLRDKAEAVRTGVTSDGRTPFSQDTERQAAQRIVERALLHEAKLLRKRNSDTIAWGVLKGGMALVAVCAAIGLLGRLCNWW